MAEGTDSVKIYVYDNTVDKIQPWRALDILFGQRYMAVVDEPRPKGRIAGWGYTPAQAARRARKNAYVVRRSVGDSLVAEFHPETAEPATYSVASPEGIADVREAIRRSTAYNDAQRADLLAVVDEIERDGLR